MARRDSILIVGAGPTGLMLAVELARLGVHARIIEKRREPSSTSKALAVFARSLELYQRIGVVDEAIAHGVKLTGGHFHAGGQRLASISTDGLESPFPFILALPQSHTERILERRLNSLGVQVERETTLDSIQHQGESVQARIVAGDGTATDATFDWVIGCDGAHSVVREQSDIEFEGADLHQAFMFADATVSWDTPRDHVNAFFSPSGVVAAIPVPPGQAWRVIVSLPEGEAAPREPKLADIEAIMRERTGQDVTMSDPIWLSGFEVRQRKVDRYRSGRVLLAGDAAHAHSPVGGQGMNTGLQDASNLAWKLALVSTGQASQSLLDTYHEEREPIARELLRGTGLATKMVALHSQIAQTIRNHLMQFVLGFEAVQDRIVETMSEMRIDYRGCALSVDQGHGGAIKAGDRAPDAAFMLLRGGEGNVFELLRTPGFHLLVFAGENADDASVYASAAREHARNMPTVQLHVHEIALHGSAQAIERYHTNSRATAALIRPDGYISLRQSPLDADALGRHLAPFAAG